MYSVGLEQSQNDVSSIGGESNCQCPKSIATTSPESTAFLFFPYLSGGECLHRGRSLKNK